MEGIVERIKTGIIDFSDNKIKTAYALNLCTVSISQIIDYADINVLEQEYETILNNLNIEQMPKDEALLKILKELLDTITFFRIQEGDKEFIDREYQNKMKNAIWNAVPNFGVIFAGGNPYTAVIGLASQIGSGYMNYRKSKAENQFSHEKELWSLHRSAIEQFNGLRRELFDTAWRLAEAYEFPDSYRLTERQVNQYDRILLDSDPYRRYERLDTIKEAFIAYPPFWYFIGNTANEIANLGVAGECEEYRALAKAYFEIFIHSIKECNLLRENQIASSCALEYISILDADADKEKINELIRIAVEMSGNANDILQLCAFAYLKLDNYAEAEKILNILVNEDYNAIVNAQLLSRLYITGLSDDKSNEYKYNRLCTKVDKEYLYPMPQNILAITEQEIGELSDTFIANQREILVNKFGIVINQFQEKYRVLFNKCVPIPDDKEYTDSYYNGSVGSFELRKLDGQVLKERHGLDNYAEQLIKVDYPYNYLLVLNNMYDAICSLNCTQGQEGPLLQCLSNAIISNRETLLTYRNKAEDEKITLDDYYELIDIKFDDYTSDFFNMLISLTNDYLDSKSGIVTMNDAETNLRAFCLKEGFDTPEVLYKNDGNIIDEVEHRVYLGIELLDDGESSFVVDECRENVLSKIKEHYRRIINEGSDAEFIFEGTEKFDRYFILLDVPNKRNIRRKTVAILDDRTDSDNDILFATDGVFRIKNRKLKDAVAYEDIHVETSENKEELIIKSKYENESVNITNLIKLMEALSKNETLERKESSNPLSLLKGLIGL